MNEKEKQIRGALFLLGLEVNEVQIKQFLNYYKMLIEKNKVMNLTAITEFDEVVIKHFVDSLSIVKAVDIKKVEKMIDVGTGAGFPGIPIKIAFPHIKITLMDSLNKRIRFLNDVMETLGLDDIENIHSRAEDLAHDVAHRERYDVCVSRAVANISTLAEYCIPFVRVDGMFVSYKSGSIEDELKSGENAVRILGGSIKKVKRFELPESDIARALVCIKKEKPSAKKYPRKAGLPESKPI